MVSLGKKYPTLLGLINAFALVKPVFLLERERERERRAGLLLIINI